MNDRNLSRRQFLDASLLAIPALARPDSDPQDPRRAALHIVCLGAHPDDPESGCGGTLARYAAAGHGVTIIYLTRGERGIAGRTLTKPRGSEGSGDPMVVVGQTEVVLHTPGLGENSPASEAINKHVVARCR